MPTQKQLIALAADLWYQALDASSGIAIEIECEDCNPNDQYWLMQALWKARQALGDPILEGFHVVRAPKVNEVWICKKTS